jgi:hypothetical protein
MKRKGQLGLVGILPYLPYIIIGFVILIVIVYFIGYFSAPGISGDIGDILNGIGSGLGGGLGITSPKNYKIEIFKTSQSCGAHWTTLGVAAPIYNEMCNQLSDVPVTGTSGQQLTFKTVYANDFDKEVTIYARAVIVPEESFKPPLGAVFPSGMQTTSIGSSSCCPGRSSEAMQQITLTPNEYRIVQFTITVPAPASSYSCKGGVYSDFSPSYSYRIYIEAYYNCYEGAVETLSPVSFKATASTEPPVQPVAYSAITMETGSNIAHYLNAVKVENSATGAVSSCTMVMDSPQKTYSCPGYGEHDIISVWTTVRNSNPANVEFLSEAILHPMENYNPFGLPATFITMSKSCCADSFSHGWWIQATGGASEDVAYSLKIPKGNPTTGKCSGKNYYSASRRYYLKISDYTDCAGVQVQDIAPILITFSS